MSLEQDAIKRSEEKKCPKDCINYKSSRIHLLSIERVQIVDD